MTSRRKTDAAPFDHMDADIPDRCGRTNEISTLDELWEVLAPHMCFRGKEQKNCEEKILHELIEIGEVDCGRIIQIVQLMAIREFEQFFQALCNIDLKNPASCADRLARCALRLGPKPTAPPRKKRMPLAAA